jgi:RNA polymerase-binding transcription factor DksA
MTDNKKKKAESPEKSRYSDEELSEFKEIILAKLKKANEDLKLLMEAYHLDGEHGTDDTSPTFKILEEGYQVMSKEENSRLASRQQKFINNLENALLRIENKTYGICRVTGKLISKERLKSVPHATLSIEAKLNQRIRS